MSEPTKDQIEARARSLEALPESEYQRIRTAAESIEHWNLQYREEKAMNTELLKELSGFRAEVRRLHARLDRADRLLMAVSSDWWPYVHGRCTIESVLILGKRVTAYFTRPMCCERDTDKDGNCDRHPDSAQAHAAHCSGTVWTEAGNPTDCPKCPPVTRPKGHYCKGAKKDRPYGSGDCSSCPPPTPAKCGLTTGWEQPCANDKSTCNHHKDLRCRCGATPTYLCGNPLQFVCGAPLCDYCACNCSAGMLPRKTRTP